MRNYFCASGLGVVLVTLLLLCFCPLSSWADSEATAQIFQSEAKRLSEEARQQGIMAVRGIDGWLFFDQELAHITAGQFWGEQAAQVSRAIKPDFADPLPAILDFHAQLKEIGVKLLLVPVPPKAMVYPDRLMDGLSFDHVSPRLDVVHQEFYALLRKNGLEVLDLTDVFLKERFQEHGPLYCRQDTHWSGAGCVLAAREIAAFVKQMSWHEHIQGQPFASQWQNVVISGDLWRALGDSNLKRETVALRQVGRQTASGLESVEPDQSSPIILLGDSHNLVFQAGGDMHARGAGLADQLALELGLPVDLIAVRGSGATPARINLFRRAQRAPGYWQDKMLVIWVFTAREFTHADGWRMVPIAP